jgi:hypothetical protein
MSNRAGERLQEEVDGRLEGAPSRPTQPTSTDGGGKAVREGSSPTMEPMSVHVTEIVMDRRSDLSLLSEIGMNNANGRHSRKDCAK